MSRTHVAMTPERWKKIKLVFEQATDAPLAERATFVHRMCHGDQDLELEVLRLLSATETAAGFLETPAADLHGFLREQEHFSSLAPNTVIAGRFEILRFLNRGGMGEVYEAWDSELKERVALKTIRPGFAFDVAIIARFKREVKQARGISHPNVCRVYELFSHDAGPQQRIWFLSMELLEGPTLLDRIRYQGPMDPQVALRLVQQMVDGLTAAHALGVVHRDFKSSNVMLVPGTEGHDRAVITDFGLALNLFRGREDSPEPGGQGTPYYMAPEQKETGQVSFLADQYALGVVMCEMMTGCLPTRTTPSRVADKCAAQMDLPDYPLESRWKTAIRRCLEARPEDRFEHVADVMAVLDPSHRLWNGWQAGALAALALLLAVIALLPRAPVADRVTGLSQLTPATDLSDSPSLSRNGKLVAYMSDRAKSGNTDIFVQQLADGRMTQVTSNPANDTDPSLSPDGTLVVFRSDRNGGGIYLSRATGGGEHLLEQSGRNPRFSPDGQHVAYWIGDRDLSVASGQIYVVSISGGTPLRLARDFIDARLPIWSSDGRFILFAGCRAPGQLLATCTDWWVTTPDGQLVRDTKALTQLNKANIKPLDVIGDWHGETVLFKGQSGPVVSLWELPLSPHKLQAGSNPQRIISVEPADSSSPSLSDDNTLAFAEVAGTMHIQRIEDALHPSDATLSNVTGSAVTDRCPYISHNGRWLVFARGYGNRSPVWIKDTNSGAETQFIVTDQDKYSPIVDDSGNTIAFEAAEDSVPSIYTTKRNQSPSKLCSRCSNPTSWFDGDRGIFYREGSPSRIILADVATKKIQIAVQQAGSSLGEASWSPENHYLLFTKELVGGKRQIFATRFPNTPGIGSDKWIPLTEATEWSARPRWSGDGKNVFYLSTRDGFSCIWGRHFDPDTGKTKGRPFEVMHLPAFRNSIENVFSGSFNLSVAGNSVYLNIGQSTSSIWTGTLKPSRKLVRFR